MLVLTLSSSPQTTYQEGILALPLGVLLGLLHEGLVFRSVTLMQLAGLTPARYAALRNPWFSSKRPRIDWVVFRLLFELSLFSSRWGLRHLGSLPSRLVRTAAGACCATDASPNQVAS